MTLASTSLAAPSRSVSELSPLAPARPRISPWTGTLLGFVAGSVFWHFVGFWDFVGRIVFHTPKERVQIAGQPTSGLVTPKVYDQLPREEASEPVSATKSGSATAAANCITLVRSAATGLVESVACPPDSVPTRVGTALSRGDLARVAENTPLAAPATIDPKPKRSATAGWSTVTSGTGQ
jgi:hypothetical protein